MREVLIKAIPFDDLKITELEGVQQVNEHGELVFSGLMSGEKENEYISWALKKNPLVSVNVCSDNGEEKILFQGVLVDFEIQRSFRVFHNGCRRSGIRTVRHFYAFSRRSEHHIRRIDSAILRQGLPFLHRCGRCRDAPCHKGRGCGRPA